MRANERTDERVAQYFSLYFSLLSTIVTCLSFFTPPLFCPQPVRKYNKGSVLCFLPGLPEIESFNDDLATSQSEECQFQLIQLHSTVSLARQETIFKKPDKGIR